MKLLFTLSLPLLLSTEAHAQTFTQIEQACVNDSSNANCPKRYKFVGGPGYVVGQRLNKPVRMICTPPSCTNNTNPKDCCFLILALHGLFSNPYFQEWTMMGGTRDVVYTDLHNEDESVGVDNLFSSLLILLLQDALKLGNTTRSIFYLIYFVSKYLET